MNANHLPAGQPMPGGVGGVASAPGLGGGGGRRRPQQQYSAHPGYHQHYQHHQAHQSHQSHQNAGPVYQNSYMNPYANAYYPPHQIAQPYSHYSTPPYTTYAQQRQHQQQQHQHQQQQQQQQQRSLPHNHQTYPPIVVSSSMAVGLPQQYSRAPPRQLSPALSTPPPPPFPTVAPPLPAAVSQTAASAHLPQVLKVPNSPITPQTQEASSSQPDAEVPVPGFKKITLPWLSHPDEPFPQRTPKSRRRRRKMRVTTSVELPAGQQIGADSHENTEESSIAPSNENANDTDLPSKSSLNDLVPGKAEKPSSPTTVSPTVAVTPTPSVSTTTNKSSVRTIVPVLPVAPAMPSKAIHQEPASSESNGIQGVPPSSSAPTDDNHQPSQLEPEGESTPSLPTKAGPKLWSNLFQKAQPGATTPGGANAPSSTTTTSAIPSTGATAAVDNLTGPGSFAKSNTNSLAEALRDYKVSNDHKIAFLEPRGLVNTGNMCYMNSVLQALIFCTPFYDFLDQVSKKAAYSFKSETPLIDSMVMLLREYKVIDSAVSVEQLRRRLKNEELEQYGDALIPEIVYDAMKQKSRFASMQRGHQQDAEEFLGFLLQALSDECAHVMRYLDENSAATNSSSAESPSASSPASTTNDSEWLEVGRKQRAAITRSSGLITSSPISKIFSGQVRSVLRVPGLKESVTFETYQPMQLDIGDTHVNNIVDALKYYTRPEKLHGDFSPTRPDSKTTKQVLIETVPPVLILHLKRFQYNTADNSTSKLWTKIDYPLELELPKEAFSPLKRTAFQAEGAGSPKYRLTAVIYHHGKSASGGHYTVDLRRQDNQEWIRVDDTVIRRIRSEDVAPVHIDASGDKSTARTDPRPNGAAPSTGNRFEGISEGDGGDEEGWSRVSSTGTSAKKWSSVVNTTGPNNTAPTKPKSVKDNIKDNKVAYLLFYQKV